MVAVVVVGAVAGRGRVEDDGDGEGTGERRGIGIACGQGLEIVGRVGNEGKEGRVGKMGIGIWLGVCLEGKRKWDFGDSGFGPLVQIGFALSTVSLGPERDCLRADG